jgi:TolA-binding protein
LLPFRDQQQLHNVPGISDRALLRLGQAQAQAGQWDASRATFDALVQRFPQSIWVDEARYGVGWAWQNMKQLDNALAAYIEVTKRTSSELAAKAQLQIGLCRLEQKNYPEAIKALLVVPFTYDYPEQNALALCMAAQAYVELKQPAEAVKLWQQVVRNHPTSQWVKLAQQGLAGVKRE